ncbi:MAG: ribulose-phosphate 3-epimerase [Candidatus Nanopelagicaceae bacterium]
MIRICTSIINENFEELPREIGQIAEFSDLLHLDVMDNVFVPNFTFDLDKSREIIRDSEIPVDVHLMIADADKNALPYADTEAVSITVHYEACADPIKVLKDLRSKGKRAAIAIKPGTPVEAVLELLPFLDMILVMTVEPGFGGQKFMVDMMPKVEKARLWLNQNGLGDVWLQVDGGINLETIEIARKAGADAFVAGSAVFKSDDPAQVVENLRRVANSVK